MSEQPIKKARTESPVRERTEPPVTESTDQPVQENGDCLDYTPKNIFLTGGAGKNRSSLYMI